MIANLNWGSKREPIANSLEKELANLAPVSRIILLNTKGLVRMFHLELLRRPKCAHWQIENYEKKKLENDFNEFRSDFKLDEMFACW